MWWVRHSPLNYVAWLQARSKMLKFSEYGPHGKAKHGRIHMKANPWIQKRITEASVLIYLNDHMLCCFGTAGVFYIPCQLTTFTKQTSWHQVIRSSTIHQEFITILTSSLSGPTGHNRITKCSRSHSSGVSRSGNANSLKNLEGDLNWRWLPHRLTIFTFLYSPGNVHSLCFHTSQTSLSEVFILSSAQPFDSTCLIHGTRVW